MKLAKRVRHLIGRRQFERDLAEEVRFHREMSGAAFGSEALALEDSRAEWGFGWLESLARDARYALRGVRKSPAFALTVVATIGLALGLNTTLFTVFNAYVLRPIAVSDPYSLYGFRWASHRGAGHEFTVPEYEDFRRSNAAFSDALAFQSIFAALEGHTMVGQAVSGNYFAVLGVGTFLGRPLLPGDSDAIVLSYAAWKDWFGSDPAIIGRKVHLRGQPLELVGVASPAFAGLSDFPSGFFVPLAAYSQIEEQPPPNISLVGRLRSDLSPEAARTALAAWSRAEWKQDGIVSMLPHATMVPLTMAALRFVIPVFVAFGLVLLIACVNVSNMMLARALARHREIAIRLSLGAGRARLIRQLLTESLLLALPAAAAGFAISKATLDFGTRLMFATLPAEWSKVIRVIDLSPDARVFAFILAAALAAAVLFGLAPAIQTTGSRPTRPARLRDALVITQVTVCALLLICSGIILHAELRVGRQDFGIRTSGVYDVRLNEKYQAKGAAALQSEPGVESVAAVWHPPLYGPNKRMAVTPSGRKETILTGYNLVSPEYFAMFGISVIEGHTFSQEEGQAAVVVASEAAARRLWPNSDPLGRTIAIRTEPGKDPYFQRVPAFRTAIVIGIVRDVMNGWTDTGRDLDCLYFPNSPREGNNESLLVRATSRAAIEKALDRVAPSVSDLISPMDEALAGNSYPFRAAFWVTSFLGGLALVLTISGIYGVLSYLVSQRTREIGIRVALGADSASVVRMVIQQSLRLAAIGTALGALCSLAAAPIFTHTIAALQPYDAAAYLGGVLLVLAAALGAALHPSRRAAGIDPAITLRCE